MWVCLKMSCTPNPNGFADHYPNKKLLFHWEYTQHFQTNPCVLYGCSTLLRSWRIIPSTSLAFSRYTWDHTWDHPKASQVLSHRIKKIRNIFKISPKFTLWWTNIAIEHGPVEIVDLPINNGWFPMVMEQFTRGYPTKSPEKILFDTLW